MIKNALFLALFLTKSILLSAQATYTYKQPPKLEDGWATESLASQKIDSTRFHLFFNQLETSKHKMHSMLVIKNNQLVLEEYFGKNNRSQQHDLRSTTKSITAILMGIAIDKGFVENVNDPLSKYIEQPVPKKNLDPRKDAITIKHLLTMSTGFDCNDWDPKSKGQEDKIYRKSNWLQYFVDLPMINSPGEVATYCTMGQIMAVEIISRASGMPIDRFADTYLFKPLGIDNLSWGHTSNKKVITSGKRLYMTSRDLAKIGQLVLNEGNWKGNQLVSKNWIQEATTPKTKITGRDYGYLWWNLPFQLNNKKITLKVATGNGGQYIFIYPEEQLVMVFTGGAYNSPDSKLPFAVVQDVVLASLELEE